MYRDTPSEVDSWVHLDSGHRVQGPGSRGRRHDEVERDHHGHARDEVREEPVGGGRELLLELIHVGREDHQVREEREGRLGADGSKDQRHARVNVLLYVSYHERV